MSLGRCWARTLDGSYRLHPFAFYSQLKSRLTIFGLQKQASYASYGGFGQMMYRSPERSPQESRDGIFEFRGKSCVEWKHVGENGISCFLPCILLLYIEWIWTNYCKLSRNFVGAIRTTTINCRVSFIDLYSVFPRNFRMVFLPHTNTVVLLKPYCGTITEPGLPVVLRWSSHL